MHLRSLTLEEFRAYRHLELALPAGGLGLFGANASGKSTLLEAIAMLATTRSPRTTTERELLNWESGAELGFPPFARVGGLVVHDGAEYEVEIALQADPTRENAVKKQIKVNGRAVRAMDAVGLLKAVLFSPEDVGLVSGPPSLRRRYLDLTISQLDGRYLRALSRYNRILEQRNSLLKALAREGVAPSSPAAAAQLAYWDEELVAFGSRVTARRVAVVARLATLAAERFGWLSEGRRLVVRYAPSLPLPGLDEGVIADPAALEAVVSRAYGMLLGESRADELRRGATLVGPHRDDLTFAVDGADLAKFGSRGQQRLAVVGLKLAEADLMREEAGESPLILLDDVHSELDEQHREMLTAAIVPLGAQVVITATDRRLLELPALAGLPRLEVAGGTVRFARDRAEGPEGEPRDETGAG